MVTERQAANPQPPREFDPADGARLTGLVELLVSGAGADRDPAELVTLATAAVTSSRHACLALADVHERVRTLAATSADAAALDRLQQDLREGPAMDLVDGPDVVCVPDIETASPWPGFAAAARRRGVRSLLVVRVPVETVGVASLTFYADEVDAFGERDRGIAEVCGSFVGLILRSARDQERLENLEIALASSRLIGTAVGIVMARELLPADQAFERLRATSQRTHRKLRDLAEDVVNTGQLP